MKNIVLVHGGFVDGAGWEGVYKILKRDGYSVSIVQNPTISFIKDPPPGALVPPILPPQDGFLFLDKAKFPLLSQPTWTRKKPRSWLIPKFRGAWGPLAARSREATPSTYRSQKRSQILLNRLRRKRRSPPLRYAT